MKSIMDWVIAGVNLLSNFALPMARLLTLLAIATAFWASSSQLYTSVITGGDALILPDALVSPTSADFRPLAFVNFLFPLTEMMALLTAYMAIYAAAAVIRIIKSFIPTIA